MFAWFRGWLRPNAPHLWRVIIEDEQTTLHSDAFWATQAEAYEEARRFALAYCLRTGHAAIGTVERVT